MSDPEYDDEYYEDGDEAVSEGGMEGLDPDHPLLARAQAALKKQLLDTRLDLDEKIREKNEELTVRSLPLAVPHPLTNAFPSPAIPRPRRAMLLYPWRGELLGAKCPFLANRLPHERKWGLLLAK